MTGIEISCSVTDHGPANVLRYGGQHCGSMCEKHFFDLGISGKWLGGRLLLQTKKQASKSAHLRHAKRWHVSEVQTFGCQRSRAPQARSARPKAVSCFANNVSAMQPKGQKTFLQSTASGYCCSVLWSHGLAQVVSAAPPCDRSHIPGLLEPFLSGGGRCLQNLSVLRRWLQHRVICWPSRGINSWVRTEYTTRKLHICVLSRQIKGHGYVPDGRADEVLYWCSPHILRRECILF